MRLISEILDENKYAIAKWSNVVDGVYKILFACVFTIIGLYFALKANQIGFVTTGNTYNPDVTLYIIATMVALLLVKQD